MGKRRGLDLSLRHLEAWSLAIYVDHQLTASTVKSRLSVLRSGAVIPLLLKNPDNDIHRPAKIFNFFDIEHNTKSREYGMRGESRPTSRV